MAVRNSTTTIHQDIDYIDERRRFVSGEIFIDSSHGDPKDIGVILNEATFWLEDEDANYPRQEDNLAGAILALGDELHSAGFADKIPETREIIDV